MASARLTRAQPADASGKTSPSRPLHAGSRLMPAVLILLLLVGAPLHAQAHSAWAGSSSFGNGLVHPFFTPRHILLLAALGLWLGQKRPLTLKLPFLSFGPVSALALAYTAFFPVGFDLQLPLAILLCLAGVLVALEATLPRPVLVLLFAATAVALGLDSGPDKLAQPGISIMLFGTWLGLVILLVNVAYYSSLLPPKPWARIGLRIAGSWLSAIGFLLIAFSLRQR